MTPVTATVRNTVSADRNCMARLVCYGDHLTHRSEMAAQLSNIAQFCDDLAFVIARHKMLLTLLAEEKAKEKKLFG
jgi:hypothetical protein